MMSWASSLKGGLLFTFPSSLFPLKTLPLASPLTLHLYLTCLLSLYPLYTMSNNVTSAIPITFTPSSTVSSPESIYQSLTLTLPQEPVTAPVPIPSPCVQTNPVIEYPTHTEDRTRRIESFHIPYYVIEGVRESLRQGDGIAFLAQSEALLQ